MMGVHHGVLCMNIGKWMGSSSWLRLGMAGLGWVFITWNSWAQEKKVLSEAEEESVEVASKSKQIITRSSCSVSGIVMLVEIPVGKVYRGRGS